MTPTLPSRGRFPAYGLQAPLRSNVRTCVKPLHLVSLVLALCACIQASAADYPSEVKKFLELRESCDHWRGEGGYDEDRQADINWAVCQSCQGTDAQLARLKEKYKSNARVIEALNELEPEIEPKDKEEAKRFCSTTRKPKWQR